MSGAGYSRRHLTWVRDEATWVVRHGRTKLTFVAPDEKHPGMWRVRSADGPWSDIINLTRAKDAAASIALAVLNRSDNVASISGAALQRRKRKSTVGVPSDTARSPAAAL
jgi:hypothetical protein